MKMKVISLALLAISSLSAFAEATYKEVLYVEYQILSRNFAEASMPEPYHAMLLSSDGTFSKFYEGIPKRERATVKKRFNFCDEYEVYKNYPAANQLTYRGEVSKKPFTYTEPVPDFEWQMLDGDSVVCGYNCQKAKATFRGRTWTVWYAMDLPYSDGPWKLCGLPGLILRAIDDKGDYLFTAIEISKGDGAEIKINLKGAKKSTPEGIDKELKKYWSDPDAYTGRVLNSSGKFYSNGVLVEDKPTPSRIPNPLELFNDAD